MSVSIPLITGLLGLAGLGMNAYAMNQQSKAQSKAQASALQALQASQDSLSALPEAPQAPTGNEEDAAANAAEAERQKQLQALAANDESVSTTGGLGLSSLARSKKKTLGGS